MKKLLMIDGNAILHRAYHAYPPLTNPSGEVINAVFGFFSMLLTVLQDQKPDYLVVCFDRSKPTIRQTMFAGYHAHRPKVDDGFISQVKIVDDIVERMNVSVFTLDGFEADDLIGTIASKVSGYSYKSEVENGEPIAETIIVTGDRDLLQLVNPHVKVLMPLIGLTKTILMGEEEVEAKYGVHPRQFIDYKALIGDASDGYPGVTGIGPKTAANLLQEYKTFENLYANVGLLPVKTGLKLATDAEQAALAKQLATIITDAPIQFTLEKCDTKHFDIKALRQAFREQGFNSLLARVDTIFGKEKEQMELL
jgi:DNA polymerase I